MKNRLVPMSAATIVLAFIIAVPSVAHAHTLRSFADRVSVGKAAAISSNTFAIKAYCMLNVDGSPTSPRNNPVYAFKGHMQNTIFKVSYLRRNDSTYTLRVGYAAFNAYLTKYKRIPSPGDITFVWKTDSAGNRFRFAQIVSVAYFAE